MVRKSEMQTASMLANGVNVMDIVHAAFMTPMGNLFTAKGEEQWGLPMFFEGPPGAAKTSKFYGIAKKYRVPFETLKPGSRGEGFFGCTPTRGDLTLADGTKVSVLDFPLPRNFVLKFMDGPGLILLDELPNAPPAVKPALLGFLQEHELGEMKFGPRVRIMGAGNSVAESAAGYDFTPPEANRMGHLPWPDPSISEVISHLTSAGRRDDNEEAYDLAGEESRVQHAFYSKHYPIAAGLTAGFLSRRADMLRRQPEAGDSAASGPWASPRTWEYATRAFASASVQQLSDATREMFVGSFIGHAVATEFFTWQRQQDLPNPQDILDGKVEFKHERTRLDRTAVSLHACVAFMMQPNVDDRLKRAERLWEMIGKITEDAADICMPAVNQLNKAKLLGVPAARKVLAGMDYVAGMTRR